MGSGRHSPKSVIQSPISADDLDHTAGLNLKNIFLEITYHVVIIVTTMQFEWDENKNRENLHYEKSIENRLGKN